MKCGCVGQISISILTWLIPIYILVSVFHHTEIPLLNHSVSVRLRTSRSVLVEIDDAELTEREDMRAVAEGETTRETTVL